MSIRIAALAALSLFAGAASAQVSGISGISSGLGSDFAASNINGGNTKADGGLAASLDDAFGDDINKDRAKGTTPGGAKPENEKKK